MIVVSIYMFILYHIYISIVDFLSLSSTLKISIINQIYLSTLYRYLFVMIFHTNYDFNLINSFSSILQVRHFIDGMHEHILSSRGVSLALLYEREKQRYMIKTSKKSSSDDNNINIASITAIATPAANAETTNTTASTIAVNTTTTNVSSTATNAGITSVINAVSEFVNIKSTLSNSNINNTTNTNSSSSVAENNYDLTSKSSLQFLKENNLDLDVSYEDVIVMIIDV